MSAALALDGRAWFRTALSVEDLDALDKICALKQAPGVRLSASAETRRALAPLNRIAASLIPGARPVRLVAFDKSAEANWALPWHQDRVIAVSERLELDGWTNWTRKAGVWHVEPPVELFERMIFVRAHLDAADALSGCLELAPGTHRLGVVAADRAAAVADAHHPELCSAARGDVLAASALILHRSRASGRAASRRALRVDYAAESLPAPLRWAFEDGPFA